MLDLVGALGGRGRLAYALAPWQCRRELRWLSGQRRLGSPGARVSRANGENGQLLLQDPLNWSKHC